MNDFERALLNELHSLNDNIVKLVKAVEKMQGKQGVKIEVLR